MDDRPPFKSFGGVVCRGSYALGTACGRCERCAWERAQGRFVSPSPPPTSYERECAEILIEETSEIIKEAAELQQRATKLLRFGVLEVQPGQSDSNRRRLGLELGDLLETMSHAECAGIINPDDVAEGQFRKRRQLEKFMQHAPP